MKTIGSFILIVLLFFTIKHGVSSTEFQKVFEVQVAEAYQTDPGESGSWKIVNCNPNEVDYCLDDGELVCCK